MYVLSILHKNNKRTLSPLNHHEKFACFGGTRIGIIEVMLNKDFTNPFGNIVYGTAIVIAQGKTIGFRVERNSDMSAVSVTDIDSHNRYPLSFFYIYYTPAFEKSQVKK